jgi:hypothetical protein
MPLYLIYRKNGIYPYHFENDETAKKTGESDNSILGIKKMDKSLEQFYNDIFPWRKDRK